MASLNTDRHRGPKTTWEMAKGLHLYIKYTDGQAFDRDCQTVACGDIP